MSDHFLHIVTKAFVVAMALVIISSGIKSIVKMEANINFSSGGDDDDDSTPYKSWQVTGFWALIIGILEIGVGSGLGIYYWRHLH